MHACTRIDLHAGRGAKRLQSFHFCHRGSQVQPRPRRTWHRRARPERAGAVPRSVQWSGGRERCGQWLIAASAALLPALAAAGSPFATGANATQQQLVAILTPIAAVAVMVSGAMAWFGRLSWWWMVAVVIGTVLVFGGPQIVSWIRGLFGV
jgi:type IV secretion system protein VirB2